jgi:hypothetical protein
MKISTVETAMAICRFQSVGQNYAAGVKSRLPVPCKSTKSARCRGTTNILREHNINVLQYFNTWVNYISFI